MSDGKKGKRGTVTPYEIYERPRIEDKVGLLLILSTLKKLMWSNFRGHAVFAIKLGESVQNRW